MYPGGTQGTKRGTYTVRDNTFNGSGTTRDNSNRLENVNATLQGNTFNNGSYLDLAGSLSNTFLFNNTFNTISGGHGIRFTQKSSSGAMLDTTGLILSGAVFNGYGMPIVNNDAAIATPSVVKVTSFGANNINLPNLGTFSPDVFYAGGRFADTITDTDGTPDWINGGAGDDSIDGGDGDDWIIGGAGNDTITTGINSMDTILYYDPSEGNDTITDFSDSASMSPDMLAFRSSTFGGITSLVDGVNFISDPTLPAPVSPAVPTFLYNSTTGQLTYDANGSNPGGTSLIATLSGAPALAVGDFKFF
jgi:Ca2+-binding RTX toxin-like protein